MPEPSVDMGMLIVSHPPPPPPPPHLPILLIITGLDDTVDKKSANRLTGTGFVSWYWLQPITPITGFERSKVQ